MRLRSITPPVMPGLFGAGRGGGPAEIPLQARTLEQLRDGMRVKVDGIPAAGKPGAPSELDSMALARLMQDAAVWHAREGATTVALATVKLHDVWGDRFSEKPWSWLSKIPLIGDRFGGYQAWANFNKRGEGHFQLVDSHSRNLEAGIARMRERPMDQWSTVERNDFLVANATILHELGHLTLKSYDKQQLKAWEKTSTPLDEGLAELVSIEHLPEFMQHEYGVTVTDGDLQLQRAASVYSTYTARLKRLLDLTGAESRDQVVRGARLIASGVDVAERPSALAGMIALKQGAGRAPKQLVDQLTEAIPDYLDDGASNHVMQIVAGMRDAAAGATLATPAFALPAAA